MSDTVNKLEQLERTVLELGTELFGLKGSMARNKESQENLVSIFNGLKQLLDEKGLINRDDFDAAIELGEALESIEMFTDNQLELDLEKLKKAGH